LTDLSNLKAELAAHITIDSFEALQKKLFVCVTNLTLGRYEICSEGELFEWVTASSSIPIVFSSRKINGYTYVDGGLLNNLPSEPLEERCDLIIGVNFTPIAPSENLGDLLKIGARTFERVLWGYVEPRIRRCDIIIEPKTDDFGLFEISQTDEIFEAGYRAAIKQIDSIKKAIAQPEGKKNMIRSLSLPRPKLGKIVNRTRIMRFGSKQEETVNSPSSLAHLPPATLFYVGRKRNGNSILNLIQFDAESLQETGQIQKEDCAEVVNRKKVNWLNIDGVHDTVSIEYIAKQFGLHPLTAEDIVQTKQRTAVEIYENYIYLNLKMLSLDTQDERIDLEQVSLVLGDHFVLSFQEKSEDVLAPLRERLRTAMGRVRTREADYLFYAIMDLIVSNYAVVTEELDERIERLEIRIDREDGKKLLEEIQELKKGLAYLKNAIVPLRSAIDQLIKSEHKLSAENTIPYFKDLSTQLYQVNEQMETQRVVLDSLREQYLSMSSFRSNEIMKVLTIVATIFIPLTFITGLYGMNFDHIPELHLPHGYLGVWVLMLSVTGGLLYYFRRRKWL